MVVISIFLAYSLIARFVQLYSGNLCVHLYISSQYSLLTAHVYLVHYLYTDTSH